ncbi:MAG: thioredoxin domain-containing protein [Gammaproteobacteria bacterium]|nr:thioredoxin domain-containing protein [Gammaproteobacteria bacterium]
MLRKVLRALAVALAVIVAGAAVLYLTNAAPDTPPISAADANDPTRPYIVKLHAQWCPVCMLTKDEWAEIEEHYADRANLLVIDSTNAATSQASATEAERLGLGDLSNRYYGATGIVVVLDGRTRDVVAEIAGNRSFDDYRAAIDAVLAAN